MKLNIVNRIKVFENIYCEIVICLDVYIISILMNIIWLHDVCSIILIFTLHQLKQYVQFSGILWFYLSSTNKEKSIQKTWNDIGKDEILCILYTASKN